MPDLKGNSAGMAFRSAQIPVVNPDQLKDRKILVRALGLQAHQTAADLDVHRNWFKVRGKTNMYKIVEIRGLQEVFDFLEREKNLGVNQDKIKIFFNGKVHEYREFVKIFPPSISDLDKKNRCNPLFVQHCQPKESLD